ncbi:MAG: aldehyde dehydrogenase family protein [Clostridiales bacterium]|nr:aldehyde dehydrogenase family protein [Clostridiales bacterium]
MENRTASALADGDVLEILEIQRDFFATGKTQELDFRRRLLLNLQKMLRENETALLDAVYKDLGKPYQESYLVELYPLYSEIKLALRNLGRWNAPKTVLTPLVLMPAVSRVYRKPMGNVLVFSTWNYPVQLSLLPLVSSIAAGNCTIIKLPENSSHTTALLCKLIDSYFDREYIAAVTDSFDTLHALRKGRFDLVFYTGGPLVAKIISKAAAEKLTPILLELGGKSPCIVDKTANLKLAAKRIVFGKALASGQTCVAPDYLFVDSQIKDKLIGYIKYYSEKFYTDKPHKNRYYPKIINSLHFERLRSYLDDGDIIIGGEVNEAENKISLTLMENIKKGSKLYTEEIFGPILPVFEYNNINTVIRFLSRRPTPLALYLFTTNRALRNKVISTLSFGNGCINDTVMQLANPHLPFGGIGLSGTGRYHGKSGFLSFSTECSIMHSPAHIDNGWLRYPPFNNDVSLMRILTRFFT